MSPTRKTGLVAHELYMWHDTGNYAGPMPYGNPVQPGTHAENPETKRRFRNLLEVAGMNDALTHIKPRSATEALAPIPVVMLAFLHRRVVAAMK